MNKKTLILLGIIGLIIIFILCSMKHWRAIETDIAQCSSEILTKSQYTTLKIDTHDKGRAVYVSGNVESEADKQKVISLLRDLCNMTGLENSIKVVIPKPTVNPSFGYSFNNDKQLTSISGKVANTTDYKSLMDLFSKYPQANNFNKTVSKNTNVIPTNYTKYTKILLPFLNRIKQVSINYTGNEVTLRGNVPGESTKQQIGKRLAYALGNKVKLINLLEVVEPKVREVYEKPLNAKDCQLELTNLLSNSMVHFNTNSAVIKDDSIELLKKLALTTKACQDVKIEIIGHTDSTGNEENNIKLSLARASSVVQYLFAAGVQAEKLSEMV